MDGKEKQGKFELSSPTASPSISEMELKPALLQKAACKILFFFFLCILIKNGPVKASYAHEGRLLSASAAFVIMKKNLRGVQT